MARFHRFMLVVAVYALVYLLFAFDYDAVIASIKDKPNHTACGCCSFLLPVLTQLDRAQDGLLGEKFALDPHYQYVVKMSPFIALFWLGGYALFSVGLALVKFNDKPSALKELETDIKNARSRLSQKGFKFD